MAPEIKQNKIGSNGIQQTDSFHARMTTAIAWSSLTNIIKKCIEDNQCVLCCGVWIYNSMKHFFAKYAITFFPTSSCRWELLDSEQTGESSVKFNCQKYAIKTDTMVFSLAMFKLGIPK